MLNTEYDSAPAISVVVNNYNYADYLAESIESALSQLGDGDEIVVVDDGSTDQSHAVLERYRPKPQVRIIIQENQRQLSTVLNGLAESRGSICVLLDSDDYLLAGYIDRLRSLTAAHPDIDLFFSAAELGGASTEGIRNMRQLLGAMELPDGPTGRTRWSTWAGGEFVGTPTSGLALRRNLVDRFLAVREHLHDRMPVNPRAARLLNIPVNSHTGYRISADGILVRGSSVMSAHKYYCAVPGFHYRIHGGNAFASLSAAARLYLRTQRSRQIARMAALAIDAARRPNVHEVLEEAAQRSRPLRRRRRMRLAFNYSQALMLSRDPLWRRLAGLSRLPFALFRSAPSKSSL